jgi:uncharacterized protein YjbI with pentapeptide repeats
MKLYVSFEMSECPGSERNLLPRGKSISNTKETTTMVDAEVLQFLQGSADDWNILTNATLLQSDLTEANLTNADLSGVDLTGVAGLNLNNA